MWLLWLILYHFIFFRTFYFQNFFHYARSELLDHEYPSFRFLGESIRQGNYPPKDPYFWGDFAGNPINATFYPPHMLMSVISSGLSLDVGFILYTLCILFHYLFSSIITFFLFQGYGSLVAFFMAITLPYFSYCIKQNASIVYTLSWMPVCLLGAKMGSSIWLALGWGMALLGGYWPLAIYFGPFAWLCGRLF